MGLRSHRGALRRTALSVAWLLIALVGVIVADVGLVYSTGPPVMRIEPASTKLSDSAAAPGAVFTVEIVVDGVTNLGAFEFEIAIDPNFFKLGDFNVGPFFNSTGRSASCLERLQDDGSARFGCTSDGPTPPGPDGTGVVATIDLFFQGTAAGATVLLLSSCNASDVLGKEILVSGCKSGQLDLSPPTPTPVTPVSPRMEKVPELQNIFLTRQGTKIPPASCLQGGDFAKLEERLSSPILFAPDPKNPNLAQEFGGFEFEVHYDETKVCVGLLPSSAAQDMTCIIEDSATSPQLEAVARLGCVSLGKSSFPDTNTAAGRLLAEVRIRPQPEIYSQAKPNQDNGVVVQMNNVMCAAADLQGHPIAIAGCDDADITFRYLEGDVEPDCVIDAADAQTIAFRWGVAKGNLIYNSFMNLEPAGTQADDDIDINDLQFVYGRFGSTCADPHPPQEPVNPKGGVEQTPTATPSPTPSPTPPPAGGNPRVNVSPDFQTLLLTSAPPPGLCSESPDAVMFQVVVKDQITSANPKDPSQLQLLGAFEFELQYDDMSLCADVQPGLIPEGEMNCIMEQTGGVIHYGCTTILGFGPSAPAPPGVLAEITVRVESDVYSIIGIGQKQVFPLVMKNCKLSDLLGHRIKSSDCSGATISVHYP